jgi:hypothetical protein
LLYALLVVNVKMDFLLIPTLTITCSENLKSFHSNTEQMLSEFQRGFAESLVEMGFSTNSYVVVLPRKSFHVLEKREATLA